MSTRYALQQGKKLHNRDNNSKSILQCKELLHNRGYWSETITLCNIIILAPMVPHLVLLDQKLGRGYTKPNDGTNTRDEGTFTKTALLQNRLLKLQQITRLNSGRKQLLADWLSVDQLFYCEVSKEPGMLHLQEACCVATSDPTIPTFGKPFNRTLVRTGVWRGFCFRVRLFLVSRCLLCGIEVA